MTVHCSVLKRCQVKQDSEIYANMKGTYSFKFCNAIVRWKGCHRFDSMLGQLIDW